MKYEFCEDCYFHNEVSAMCDECEDGDQFEPLEPEDVFDQTMQLSKGFTLSSVIPIKPITHKSVDEDELCAA